MISSLRQCPLWTPYVASIARSLASSERSFGINEPFLSFVTEPRLRAAPPLSFAPHGARALGSSGARCSPTAPAAHRCSEWRLRRNPACTERASHQCRCRSNIHLHTCCVWHSTHDCAFDTTMHRPRAPDADGVSAAQAPAAAVDASLPWHVTQVLPCETTHTHTHTHTHHIQYAVLTPYM